MQIRDMLAMILAGLILMSATLAVLSSIFLADALGLISIAVIIGMGTLLFQLGAITIAAYAISVIIFSDKSKYYEEMERKKEQVNNKEKTNVSKKESDKLLERSFEVLTKVSDFIMSSEIPESLAESIVILVLGLSMAALIIPLSVSDMSILIFCTAVLNSVTPIVLLGIRITPLYNPREDEKWCRMEDNNPSEEKSKKCTETVDEEIVAKVVSKEAKDNKVPATRMTPPSVDEGLQIT